MTRRDCPPAGPVGANGQALTLPDRVFVAGHHGLVGSALVRRLEREGFSQASGNLILRTRQELDLRDQRAVAAFFRAERPDYVFLAAATVGGIAANQSRPAEFIMDNLAIAVNVIGAAHAAGVRKLLFLGSSYIYPKLAPQPIREESFMTGSLEPTNAPYAVWRGSARTSPSATWPNSSRVSLSTASDHHASSSRRCP